LPETSLFDYFADLEDPRMMLLANFIIAGFPSVGDDLRVVPGSKLIF